MVGPVNAVIVRDDMKVAHRVIVFLLYGDVKCSDKSMEFSIVWSFEHSSNV